MISKNELNEFFGQVTPKIDYKKELNPEQYEATATTEGPVLIIAGAGSGKTRTLTYRLAYLIEKGVDPSNILLLTFTNKAATEMITRATNMLGDNYKIKGGTYHSFCANIIRKYGDKVGFKPDFLIKDNVDSADMLNYIKELFGYSKEKDFPKGSDLVAIFGVALNKNKPIRWVLENKYPKYLDYCDDIENLQKEYVKYKRERNILDYDDLLIYANKILKENPDICRQISNIYKYIMVDEYQDSNRLQFELIALLRQFENKNICVVGDDQQCVIKGTLIKTKRGDVPVEKITKEDEIMVSAGRGNLSYVHPTKIMQKQYLGDVYEITTQSGKKLTLTGDHTIFAYRKKFKPRQENTADFYMFDAPSEGDYEYNHKLFISDEDLLDEINQKNICDADEALDMMNKLLRKKKYSYLEMKQYARILDECYHFFCLVKDLEEGMFICTYTNDKIINDRIISIEVKPYSGAVYDINIDFYRNYYAGDICVHNCIYGFRGANHKNILNFPEYFTGCKTIILNRNYRSNQEILDFTNAVSMESKERFDKSLIGTHSAGYKPEIIEVDTEQTEAQAILYDIVKRHADGTPYNDMAVLIRSSKDSNILEALIMREATRYHIPYKKFGGLKFMERAFVKDIFAFLKVLVNVKDEISWFRIFQMYINIGPAYARKIVTEMNERGIEVLNDPKHTSKKYGQCLPIIYNLYNDLKTKDFSEQIDDIINIHYYGARKLSIDNKKSVASVISENRKELDENINDAQILIDMAKPYSTASDFLNDLTLDANSNEDDNDFLTISTVHSVKGLEFDTVYIMNCVEKRFPYKKCIVANTDDAVKEYEEELEEERRVFYVAATRAKEHLKMYVPEYIYNFSSVEEAQMNSYLSHNKEYCEHLIISSN